MRILEKIGEALRPSRHDQGKLATASEDSAGERPKFTISSSAFRDGEKIPALYTIDGSGLFPKLTWSDLPDGCKSLILVVEDPDAPTSNPFVHGFLYNIPTKLNTLPEDSFSARGAHESLREAGVRAGKNSVSKVAYMPPSPPPGHGTHHYHFQMIAVDTMLELPTEPPSLDELKEAIEGHVVGTGEIVGVYERL